MVRATGRVKYGMPLEGQFCSEYGAADRPRRTIEESCEERVLERTDLVQIADLVLHLAAGISMLQRFYVSAIVELEQLFDAGGLACPEIVVR